MLFNVGAIEILTNFSSLTLLHVDWLVGKVDQLTLEKFLKLLLQKHCTKLFFGCFVQTRVNESRGNNLLLFGASPGNATHERVDMFLQVEETQLSRYYQKNSRTCTSSFLMYSFLPFCLRSTLRSNLTSRIFFVTSAKHIVKYLVEILCMMKITVLF